MQKTDFWDTLNIGDPDLDHSQGYFNVRHHSHEKSAVYRVNHGHKKVEDASDSSSRLAFDACEKENIRGPEEPKFKHLKLMVDSNKNRLAQPQKHQLPKNISEATLRMQNYAKKYAERKAMLIKKHSAENFGIQSKSNQCQTKKNPSEIKEPRQRLTLMQRQASGKKLAVIKPIEKQKKTQQIKPQPHAENRGFVAGLQPKTNQGPAGALKKPIQVPRFTSQLVNEKQIKKVEPNKFHTKNPMTKKPSETINALPAKKSSIQPILPKLLPPPPARMLGHERKELYAVKKQQQMDKKRQMEQAKKEKIDAETKALRKQMEFKAKPYKNPFKK